MSKIQVMNEDLANKIAAGEVVERCLNVVKELVENSIDAKSSKIRVSLKDSGILEITVADDGVGMDEDDAVLAFSRHATSKLKSLNDLFHIASLGFRGEALPSIASFNKILALQLARSSSFFKSPLLGVLTLTFKYLLNKSLSTSSGTNISFGFKFFS